MQSKHKSILDKIFSYFFVKNYDNKDPYFITYDNDSPNIQDYIKNRLGPRIR